MFILLAIVTNHFFMYYQIHHNIYRVILEYSRPDKNGKKVNKHLNSLKAKKLTAKDLQLADESETEF